MNITEITYTIDMANCGDNGYTENLRYAEAVRAALQSEYPNTDVTVELSWAVVHDTEIECDDDRPREYDETCNEIRSIANRVWDQADY